MTNWNINEEQVKKILETKPIVLPESTVFNDLSLPKEKRIEHAKNILQSWKNEKK